MAVTTRKTNATEEKSIASRSLPKAPTGIQGLDEITGGGFPRGRPTLVCGSAGAGKTLLAMEFLVRGATEYNEPGVFMAFEETAAELTQKCSRPSGFDLDELVERKSWPSILSGWNAARSRKPAITTWKDCLSGWATAIDRVGAKRVVLDTIENLFAGLQNEVNPAGRVAPPVSLAER